MERVGRHRRIVRALLVLALTTLLAAGCGILQRMAAVQSWVGRPASELVRAQGQPTRVERSGRGGQVYIYEWTEEYATEVPGRAWRDPTGERRWTRPRTETRSRRERQSYVVGPQGIILDASWPVW